MGGGAVDGISVGRGRTDRGPVEQVVGRKRDEVERKKELEKVRWTQIKMQ